MKTRKKVMEATEEMPPKKIIRVDDEIEVLVSDLSSDFGESDTWPTSVENGHPLVFMGNRHTYTCTTSTKRESPTVLAGSATRITRQWKENMTPRSRTSTPTKFPLSFSSTPPNGKANSREIILQQNLATSTQTSQTSVKEPSVPNLEDTKIPFNDETPSKLKSTSPVKHITESPNPCTEPWQVSSNFKYVDSTNNVPSPSEGAVAPDSSSGITGAACPSPDSTTTKCSARKPTIVKQSDSAVVDKNCDSSNAGICATNVKQAGTYRRTNREMAALYVNLKEISWAQHWNAKTILGSNKQRYSYRTNRQSVTPVVRKATDGKSSSIYAKFYPPKKTATVSKSVPLKESTVLTTPPKKTIGLKMIPKNGDKEGAKTPPKQVVSQIAPVEHQQTHRGQMSITKYMKHKVIEKQKNNPAKHVTAAKSEDLPQQEVLIKVEVPKLVEDITCTGSTAERTKSSAIRFDFVSKSKKNTSPVNVDQKMIDGDKGMCVPNFIKKENGRNDKHKPPPRSLLETASWAKGKPMCADSNVCQDGNVEADRIGILGNLFQKQDVRKRKLEDDMVRSSVRQSECAFRYKEIAVKKHSNYIQIILVPNLIRQNSLSLEALKELKEAFLSAQKDPTCKVVLLNSSGNVFCSGLDLAPLIGADKEKIATMLAATLKSLVETLVLFSKPLVAAVNGKAVGFGVTLLPFCDVVFASDKATFHTPYARLGYIPEAAATLTLPQAMGSTSAMNMLLRGQKLTAMQAQNCGLVSEVLWPSKFMEEVIPRIQAMATQSLQVMEVTKVMLRCHQWEKLQAVLQTESRLLSSQWLTPFCQKAIREMLANRLDT